MRLMVMSVNENRVLCELLADRTVDCNEMDGMRRGFHSIKELQDYVDAQAGGPGKGFFQIVTNPFEARQVINQGRMAVVLEIETSEPFDCRGWETVTCDKAQIDRADRRDAHARRALLAAAQQVRQPADGRALRLRRRRLRDQRRQQAERRLLLGRQDLHRASCTTTRSPSATRRSRRLLNSDLRPLGFPTSTIPQYPPAPHCNTRGLTDLGRYANSR